MKNFLFFLIFFDQSHGDKPNFYYLKEKVLKNVLKLNLIVIQIKNTLIVCALFKTVYNIALQLSMSHLQFFERSQIFKV